MSDIVINVEEPEVVITDEYSTDYDLPIASSTILGGVKIGANINIASDGKISLPYASAATAGVIKVGSNLSIDENGVLSGQAGGSVTIDSTLSTVSTNPVQNRVITNAINPIVSGVETLQGDISSINDDISNLSESLGTTNSNVTTNANSISQLQSAVTANTDDIETNVGNIANNTSDISDLQNRLTTDEGYITDNGNSIATMSGNITPLLVTFSETANGTDIDNTIWNDGAVTIIRRGKMGVVKLTLAGSYTLQSASSKLVYTMSDQDNLPTFVSNGCLYTDDGVVYAEFDTDGKLTIYNYGSQNITLTYLTGSIPVIFV